MIKKLLAISIFAHLALSKWWVDKTKATHITKQISNDNMIKAYLTLTDNETEEDKVILVHRAILHLVYSTPLVNKTSAKWESITFYNGTFLFTMEIPKEGIISMNTHISDADYKKFVLLEKEKEEKESTDLVAREEGDEETTEEEKGITKEERDKFLNSLLDNTDGAFLEYQASNVKGSFKLKDQDEDDNCQFAKYNFNNGTDFVHLPVLYCDLYRVSDDAKRQEEAKKALGGYKANPNNAIVIPNMSTEMITLIYTQMKEIIDKKREKAGENESTEASSTEETTSEKTTSEETTAEKTTSETTSTSSSDNTTSSSSSDSTTSSSSSDNTTSSSSSDNTTSSSSSDDSTSSSSSSDKEATKWYKSGWFIALVVIFVVLVITGIVLTVLMVGSKDKTLDYTS